MHPWVKGIQVCPNEGPRPFPRGDKNKIAKNTLTNFRNLLLHNHWANEGAPIFQEDIITNSKNAVTKFQIFFSRTTGSISTKLGTLHPCLKGIQVCSNLY